MLAAPARAGAPEPGLVRLRIVPCWAGVPDPRASGDEAAPFGPTFSRIIRGPGELELLCEALESSAGYCQIVHITECRMYVPSANRLRAAENLRMALVGGNAELVGLALRLSLAHLVQRWSIARLMQRIDATYQSACVQNHVDLDLELQY